MCIKNRICIILSSHQNRKLLLQNYFLLCLEGRGLVTIKMILSHFFVNNSRGNLYIIIKFFHLCLIPCLIYLLLFVHSKYKVICGCEFPPSADYVIQVNYFNRYIITWMLHQISMCSNKEILAAG